MKKVCLNRKDVQNFPNTTENNLCAKFVVFREWLNKDGGDIDHR